MHAAAAEGRCAWQLVGACNEVPEPIGFGLLQAGNAWRLLFSRERRAELVVSCAVAFFSQINVRGLPCYSFTLFSGVV